MGILFLASKDGKKFLLSKDGRHYLARRVRDDIYEVIDCKLCESIGEVKTVEELLNKIKEEQKYEA